MRTRTALEALLALLVLSFALTARADTIPAGFTYVAVGQGGLDIPGLGHVNLQGVQIPGMPFGTNMVINHLAPATPTETIPTEIVALSLVSTSPIQIQGSFFDVLINLGQPQSLGSTTFYSNGTFDSFFDVYFEITLTPVGGGQSQTQQQQVPLEGAGTWSTTLPPGSTTGMSPGTRIAIIGAVAGGAGAAAVCASRPNRANGCLPVSSPQVPEPGTVFLVATGLAGILGLRRRST